MPVHTISIFDYATPHEIYDVLISFANEDLYVADFIGSNEIENFLGCMLIWDYVWQTSDNRILLTALGEKLLQELVVTVELSRKPCKVKRHYGRKHK